MEETELELSLKEYKKFFDEATVGLCRFDIKNGRFLMANDYCARMLGYDSPDDLIKSSETFHKLIGKEEKQKLYSRLKKEGAIEGYELKLEGTNRTMWVSAYVHVNCGGTCIQGTLININDKKMAEFELEVIKTKQLLKLNGIKEKLDTMITGYEQ